MPALAKQNAAASTLADVIGQVVDAFAEMADATPIQVGAHYLENFGTGSGPRVLFVPEPSGKITSMIEMGNAASVQHSCDVYVRAGETGGSLAAEMGGDLERFRSAYELADKVIGCLAVAATGRLEWGNYADSSPTAADAYGAEVKFSFTYRRDVRHLSARWELAPATADASPSPPLIPPGTPATVTSGTAAIITVTPEAP